MNQTQCLFARQNSNFLECFADSDCTGYSDTCVSNVCFCGSTEKCSGMIADACVMGKCKCGEHEECSDTEICSVGECVGMWFLIFTKSNLISSVSGIIIQFANNITNINNRKRMIKTDYTKLRCNKNAFNRNDA